MSRSFTETETVPRHRPPFSAVVLAPVATAALIGCALTTGVIVAFAQAPRWQDVATDVLGVAGLFALGAFLWTLPVYLRGQQATNYTRRTDELEPDAPRQTVWAQTARVGQVTTWSRLPDEPKPGALRRLADDLARGAAPSEETAARHGYSRDAWLLLRDKWVGWGWLAWRDPANHRLGLALTGSGEMWMARLADGLEMPKER